MPAYWRRRQHFIFARHRFEQRTCIVLVARVCLHRLRGLSALAAEAQVELTDALSMIAVLTSQDDFFQYLADGVHGSILLAICKLGAERNWVG